MLDFISVITSDVFWIAIGSIGAIAALALTYRQIKRADIIASADFLLKLETNFCSENMLKKRRKIMEILKNNPNDFEKMDECRDVFDFFEDLGLLLRKKAIPKELIWSAYCYWIQRYWTAFKNYVYWVRNDNDPTLYCEFEYLFNEIHSYDERKRNPSVLPFFLRRKKPIEITQEELKDFIDEEINLVPPKRHRQPEK
ncbi:MAG: hypothetical protein QW270_02875 [Candidatus Bathyarchaeia archaeon]